MKKAVIILSVIFLVSCEKMGMRDRDDDRKCEYVANESVPVQVQTSFKNKYPQNTPEKWFNKDNKGFTAVFTQNGNKMLSQFDNDGTFKAENIAPSTPPSSNHPQPEKGHHHGRPGFKGFGHHRHHGHCNHNDHDSRERGCHVELED